MSFFKALFARNTSTVVVNGNIAEIIALLGTAKDDCWQDTIAYVLKSKTIRCNV